MVPHVILPGETKRSVDIVLGGAVYVEVLMVAAAEMAKPHNAKLATYAAKWSRKEQVYDRLGITPVLFDPEDVFDPGRTAVRVADIAARLSTTPIPAAPATGKVTRAKGFWGFEGLCDAVAEVAGSANTDGALPTHVQMAEHGYGHAANILKRRGMRARVANTLDLADPHAKNVWTRERVVTELAAWCQAHGRYPVTDDVQPPGLKSAGQRLWAGRRADLLAEVSARLGVELPVKKSPNGCHDTLEGVAKLLEPLARRLGRMPTGAEYGAAGMGSAWSVASRKWGVAAVARVLGLEHPGRRGSGREGKDEAPPKFW